MYISRITLDRQRASLSRLARLHSEGRYLEHQWLWRLFSGGDPKPRDFLHRREAEGSLPRFITVSSTPPEDQDDLWQMECKPYAPKLQAGMKLAFEITVNPVITRDGDKKTGRRGRRHDVIMNRKRQNPRIPQDTPQGTPLDRSALEREAGLAWLENRTKANGFRFEPDTVHIGAYRQHQLYKKGQSHPIRFSTLDYRGLLTVTDPDPFTHLLFHGLGPAKAFGCGLMLVRRVR